MIIDRVHVAHPVLDEVIVESRSKFRTHFDPKRNDPLLGAREKHEKRGAIVPCKIDSVIEFAAGDRSRGSNSGKAARHDQKFIHTDNCWRQRFAFGRNHESDVCIRKFFAHGRERRRGQNQIADALELNEKNIQFDSWIALSYAPNKRVR